MEERFEALYREYYDRVLGYALRRAAWEVAHDVVAETFTVAWRRRERLPKDPLPWLLVIARKTLANQRRSARRQQSLLTELKSQEIVHLAPDASMPALTLGEVVEALNRIPEPDRELLRLIAWDGLTPSEAAKILGQPGPACRVRLHRARRRLATELSRGEEVHRPRAAGRFQRVEEEVGP